LVPERKNFYVYVFLRSTDSLAGPKYSPYYVGKGKGNRAYSCQRRGAPRPKDSNFIAFIEEGLTEAQAFALEKYCIALYGRIDLGTGVLRNLTDGGDGVSGIVFSSETIKRLSEANLGKALPQETKDKISAAMSGRKLSEKTKQLISEGHARGKYELVSPTGAVYTVTNLSTFCQEHDLQIGNISAVINGRRPHHRGWTGRVVCHCNPRAGLPLTKAAKEKLSKAKEVNRYELTSPNGTIFTTTNLTAFSKEHNLMQSMMSCVVNGKRNTHRGWTGKIIERLS
jgi:hypothetical protein